MNRVAMPENMKRIVALSDNKRSNTSVESVAQSRQVTAAINSNYKDLLGREGANAAGNYRNTALSLVEAVAQGRMEVNEAIQKAQSLLTE